MPDKKPPIKTQDVVIWGVHTHKGKTVEPGSTITVTDAQAAFLKAAGVLDNPTKEAE